ncbi:MAG: hypothetical protein ACTSR3_09815, partial [Candidatus Helarchaeota archaeon]
MGFLLSYILCLGGAFFIQKRYSQKMSKKNITYIATRSFYFLLAIFIVDTLIILGMLDHLILLLNNLPWNQLPWNSISSGLDWYFNCWMLGLIDFNIPVQNFPFQINQDMVIFALILETTYLSFYRNGLGWGKAFFGKRPSQEGFISVLRPLKKPKNWKEMERKWKSGKSKR